MKSETIEQVTIEKLIPYAKNSRTHSDAQIAQIAASIKEFGFVNPVLIDEQDGIIAGHGRVMAARKLGIDEVPCIRLVHLTENQKRAYVIADNKLALNAGWDEEMLKLEIKDLESNDFDISLLGFDAKELENILDEPETTEGLAEDDEVPEPPEQPITVLGDVWILGKHRLMCGDSTNINAVDKLMNGAIVDMVYTDPPYGISIVKNNHVGGVKLAKVGIYAPVVGDENINVAIEAIQVIKTLNAKIEIIWGGNYYANALENSSCWIVWDKDNTGNFADAELAWTNQKTAVRIFKHMWNGMIKASEHGQKRIHPTQKPVKLAEWCFEQYGTDAKTVLDLFCGSGSTLLACESSGKTGFMMELSPNYCDVIIKRWQEFTGKKAVHEASGKTYNEMAA
jgi:DNA modification methylase